MKKKDIHVAHSPDSDDAFMFYTLATRKIDTGDLNYIHFLKDIETLNRKAMKGEFEVSAISFHAYAYLSDKYALLSSGASMGRNYGPIVISGKRMQGRSLAGKTVAIPGTLTTAFLTLRLFEPEIKYQVVPFDKIVDEVQSGKYEAGLLIHEGQLTYREMGLHKVIDLGEWWQEETGLPLPLGGNVIKRDLGEKTMERVSKDIRKSIQYALDHRDEALAYAMLRTDPRRFESESFSPQINRIRSPRKARGHVLWPPPVRRRGSGRPSVALCSGDQEVVK